MCPPSLRTGEEWRVLHKSEEQQRNLRGHPDGGRDAS
jgi:hypothetical protein